MVSVRSYLAQGQLASSFFGFVLRRLWVPLLMAACTLQAAEPNFWLDRWFASQTNLHTWSADLVQTRALQVLAQPLSATGHVQVQVPDFFRWELGEPAQTIALRQGGRLTLIYPRLKRAERYDLDKAPPGPWKDALALLEASFPRSRAELEAQFHLQWVVETNGVVNVAMQPVSASARKFMAGIDVSFRTNDFSLTATELRFSDGSRMRNEFSNPVLNAPISPETFEAVLPPDFTVVEPLRQ
jgi:outer membrane lipoprotein-sorting protein